MQKVSYRYRKSLAICGGMPPYIVSHCGQSFKAYIAEEKMSERLKLLKSNLDEASLKDVDLIYERMLNFPEYDKSKGFYADFDKIQTKEEIEHKRKFAAMQDLLRRKYVFSEPFAECVFYYHHGLKLLDRKIHDYIRNKDFLDIGCWIGDTALVLQEYSPRKVYSFDISSKVLKEYCAVMKNNNIDEARYETVLAALGKESKMIFVDFYERDLSTSNTVYNEGKNRVIQTTIDEYVDEHNLNVGLIQADIEGAEFDMILGAEKTIKLQKPVLLIDIYHRPDQFFELKPMLESWSLGYNFMIRNFKFKNLAVSEIVLIAYPNF